MPSAPDRVIWEYTDVAGGFLRASNWLVAGLSPAALTPSVAAGMNGAYLYVTSALPTIGTATPVAGQWDLTQDVALFNFQTIPGVTVQLAVPTPKLALFGANSTVIDPTAPLSAAIIAAAIGLLADAGGNAATAYAGGSKSQRTREQI